MNQDDGNKTLLNLQANIQNVMNKNMANKMRDKKEMIARKKM